MADEERILSLERKVDSLVESMRTLLQNNVRSPSPGMNDDWHGGTQLQSSQEDINKHLKIKIPDFQDHSIQRICLSG